MHHDRALRRADNERTRLTPGRLGATGNRLSRPSVLGPNLLEDSMTDPIWLRMSMVLAVLFVACGGSSSSDPATSLVAGTTSPTTAAPTNETSADGLPGQAVDFGPRVDDALVLVGVAQGGKVNLRALPGATQQTIYSIAPAVDELTALGETRLLDTSHWIKVDASGTVGWIHLGAVGYLGGTDDITAAVISDLGATPEAVTMEALGLIVAESLASTEPPSRIVVTVAETAGDLGEVTYDVIGLGDDSVLGLRLHVFGVPVGTGFGLKTVERTLLCGRGVSDELCL